MRNGSCIAGVKHRGTGQAWTLAMRREAQQSQQAITSTRLQDKQTEITRWPASEKWRRDSIKGFSTVSTCALTGKTEPTCRRSGLQCDVKFGKQKQMPRSKLATLNALLGILPFSEVSQKI